MLTLASAPPCYVGMSLIGDLTNAQTAQILLWRDKWLAAAASCAPADRPTAESAIAHLYQLNNLPSPQFSWVASPSALAITVAQMTGRRRVGIWWPPSEISTRGFFQTSLESSLEAALARPLIANLRAQLLAPTRILHVPDGRYAGQHEAHWICLFTYCRDVLGIQYEPDADQRLKQWEQIAGSSGWFDNLEGHVVISDRPKIQILGNDRKVHSENQAAIQYHDGCILACLHGLWTDGKVLLAPETQMLAEIYNESDPDLKGLRIARLAGRGRPAAEGLARFLAQSQSKILDQRPIDSVKPIQILVRTHTGETILIQHDHETDRIEAFSQAANLLSCDAALKHSRPHESSKTARVRPKLSFADPLPMQLVGHLYTGKTVRHSWQVFLSVLPTEDGFIGAVRDFNIANAARETDLYALCLNHDGHPRGDAVHIGPGEDPRLFSFRGKQYCLTFLVGAQNGLDLELAVIDLQTGNRTTLTHDLKFTGKNWMPVMGQSTLWFIRSIVPLMIFEADLTTGGCRTIVSWGDEAITEYRGGAPAWRRGNEIVGFGHQTRDRNRHSPYHFTISLDDWSVRIRHAVFPPGWDTGVVDPTSFWDDRLVCCRTNAAWDSIQPVEHGIFRIA
jgi:hypothetical protein